MEPDFASVWARVSGTSPEPPETQLRRFLQQESQQAFALSAAYSLACDGVLRCSLRELHGETCRHVKRLRAALYLLAGECECPKISESSNPRTLPLTLKALYADTVRASEAYRRAAASTDRPALETVFGSLAEAKRQQAEKLLSLTERLF